MSDEPERLRFRRRVDAEGFALVYHVLTLDQNLSDGAFRLYALLLRYARQDAGCWPGIERLAADLGISEPTVKRRLAELVDRGLITRERRYMRSSVTWIEDLEVVYRERAFEQLKNDTTVQLKNDTTEEQTEKNKHDGGVVSVLVGFGVDGAVARKLAATCTDDQVNGWLAYAKSAKSLADPVAFVVSRLLAGEPAPAPGHDADDRSRFIAGEFADYIDH